MILPILGGLIGLVIGWIFGHARLVLGLLLAWWIYASITSDPVRERNIIERAHDEGERVRDQEQLVTLKDIDVIFERSGTREIRATVVNAASIPIYNLTLRCSYDRPDEDEPWTITTPVATTSIIHPGESRRLSFALFGAASDAISASFECTPRMPLDEAGLLKTKLVRPKTADDRLLAQSDISFSTRLGPVRHLAAPVIVQGTIHNQSTRVITCLSLTCSALKHELGQIETVRGGTATYVAPGTLKPFEFQVGKMQLSNEKFGLKAVTCHVLRLHGD
jgi:hypothetical protein